MKRRPYFGCLVVVLASPAPAQVPMLRLPSGLPRPKKAAAPSLQKLPRVTLDGAANVPASLREQMRNRGAEDAARTKPEAPTGATTGASPGQVGSAAGRRNLPRRTAADWLDGMVTRRIRATGNRRLAFRNHTVDGDRDAFATTNYWGQGGQSFTDNGQLNLAGQRVLGLFNFNVQFSDNRLQDPDQQRMAIDVIRGPFRVTHGDISGQLLNTNPFASFTKNLRGTMMGVDSGRFRMRGLRSEVNGTVRTVTLEGNNSAGPYYLQSGRILPDTLSVMLDGEPLKLGEHYVVDTDLGAITFLDRTISPTSAIVATFEASTFGQSRGLVQGMGADYDFGRFGRLGFSSMEQRGSGDVTGRTLVEMFQGYGEPSTPYALRFQPIPGTLVVRIGPLLQVAGVDFDQDARNPTLIYFRRYVDPAQTVFVTYRPQTARTLDGDRQTWGWDYRLPLGRDGRRGFLSYAEGTGRLLNPDNPVRSTSRGIDGAYRVGMWRLTGSVRQIPNDYVSVESRGFNRNEDATRWGLNADAGRWTYALNATNSSVAQRTSDTQGNARFDPVRVATQEGRLSYSDAGGTRWDLGHRRLQTRRFEDTRLDTTSFTGTKAFERLTTRFGFERQSGVGRFAVDGGSSQRTSVALQTLQAGANYRLDEAFSLDARASVSDVRTGVQSGTGNDYGMTLSWRRSNELSVLANFTASNAGRVSALGGFANGLGAGFGASGFSGGMATPNDVIGAGGNNTRLWSLETNWRPKGRLGVDANVTRTDSFGNLTANASSNSAGVGIGYFLGRSHAFSARLDRTESRFGGGAFAGSNRSTNFTLALNGQPARRLSYEVSTFTMLSSGQGGGADSQFATFSMGYLLGARDRLSMSWANRFTTGAFGQRENHLSLIYDYRIWQNFGISASYHWRNVRNLQGLSNAGAYRSRGFDFEFIFNF